MVTGTEVPQIKVYFPTDNADNHRFYFFACESKSSFTSFASPCRSFR